MKVALIGPPSSGKSTLAKELLTQLPGWKYRTASPRRWKGVDLRGLHHHDPEIRFSTQMKIYIQTLEEFHDLDLEDSETSLLFDRVPWIETPVYWLVYFARDPSVPEHLRKEAERLALKDIPLIREWVKRYFDLVILVAPLSHYQEDGLRPKENPLVWRAYLEILYIPSKSYILPALDLLSRRDLVLKLIREAQK